MVLVETHGRIVHHGLGVQVGPFAGGHGDLGHALTRAVFAELVQIPSTSQGVVDWCADDSIGRFVLAEGEVAVGGEPGPGRASGLSVGDQRHLAVTGADRGHGVGHVDHE